jgi:hypothetical protein
MSKNVANPVGGIMSTKGKYHTGWEAMNENPDDSVAHQVVRGTG